MEVNHIYMSPKEYHDATGGCIGVEEIKRLCRIGQIPCLRTDGGYYKIKVYKGDCISREKYEKIVQENIKLKQILSNINNISNLKGEKDG